MSLADIEAGRADDAGLVYLLWSNKHAMWWRAQSRGYSPEIADAGRYSEADALERVLASAQCGILEQVTCMVAAPDNWGRS